MGKIMHGGSAYGGGNSVDANPAGTATDELVKAGINGTVYEVADDDYRSTQHTFTTTGYDSSTHKFEGSEISMSYAVKSIFSPLATVYNAIKTAINDHAGVFTTISSAISDINTALQSKVDKVLVYFNELSASGRRFGTNLVIYENFTAGNDTYHENNNLTAIKTVVNNLADYAEENVEIETIPNTTPYLYRQSPAIGSRVMENALVGCSFGVNQLVQNSDKSGSVTIGSYNYADIVVVNNNITTPHFLLAKMSAKVDSGTVYFHLIGKDENDNLVDIGCATTITTTEQYVYILCKAKDYISNYGIILRAYGTEGKVYSWDDLNIIDLTQWFGSDSIPNNAYTKETAQAGSGITWLKDNGFDFSKYIPNNPGIIESVNPTGKKVVGKNLFDKSNVQNGALDSSGNVYLNPSDTRRVSDYIEIVPNTVYYLSNAIDLVNGRTGFWYDANKTAISQITFPSTVQKSGAITSPNNAKYAIICVPSATLDTSQLEFGSTATPYTPYEEHTYQISPSPLRGIPTLLNDAIVYDGDVRKSDGTLDRNYGIVDLGSLNWSYDATQSHPFFYTADLNTFAIDPDRSEYSDNILLCAEYMVAHLFVSVSDANWADASTNKSMTFHKSVPNYIYIRDDTYADATIFKTAVSGVYLIYELATPTTETSTPFDNPQNSYVGGTEEFITDNDIPVGHDSEYKKLPPIFEDDYIQNLQARVENPLIGNVIRLASNTVTLCKIGNMVIAQFYNVDSYTYVSLLELIPSEYADFRPVLDISFMGTLHVNNSSSYIGVVDLTTDGKMMIWYKNSISSRAQVGPSGHKFFGVASWITSL